ncbi:MAG: DUF4430 domain-containing protein [Lachnospiraceae bacterium]|nr:DUF4430 domain-containing protein [Lachnospiraceae bacterium]
MKRRISRFLAGAMVAGLVVSAPIAAFADETASSEEVITDASSQAASEADTETKAAEESNAATEAAETGAAETKAETDGDAKDGSDTTTTGTEPASGEGNDTVGATAPVAGEKDDTDAPKATKEITAHVRVEGIDKMLYNSDVTVKVAEGEKATAKSVLMAADEQSDALTIVGADANYITEVNGVKAATYGGWDGWMYQVNGTAAPVGIDAYEIAAGDSIVLYYSDEYGIGMDYPVMNTEKIAEKKISFTSTKTTYDAEGKASTAEVKVADMDVTIAGETFKTDANGEITLSDTAMKALPAEISIAKYAANGCPLVLRYAPGTKVDAPAAATPTGDATPFAWLFVVAAGAATVMAATRKKEQVR